jgi:ADP-ribose pyrophosphatase YjhB (NUDIX family)
MITGAGILIVELYKSTPVVVLFGFNNYNFSDPGGRLNFGETPDMGACRECREETGNLINIKPNELQQIGIPVLIGQYQAYIVYVQNLKARDYIHNINQIFATCTDRSWKETNTITRIHISDIINSANSYQNHVNDIYGLVCQVRGRTMAIIRNSVSILGSLINNRPILLQRNLVTQSRMPCLIGTYSYTIMTTQNIMYTPQITNTVQMNNTEYAIYVIPNDSMFLNYRKNTITHITIAGFSNKYDYNQIKSVLVSLMKKFNGETWKINTKTIDIKKSIIYFKSNTLDKISKYLHKSGVKKIKGPDWHISFDSKIPSNITKTLETMKWSLCVVSKNMGQIKVYEKYKVRMR